MIYRLKDISSLVAFSLMVVTIMALIPTAPSTAQAQVRRVLVEEFTGAWCGWCPGGELQIQELQAAYPGQVVAVSFHSNQGNPLNDQMDVPQGDTLMSGISTLSGATAVQAFPDGWLSRTAINGSWNTTAQSSTPWIDTLNGNGLVEQMIGQKARATVSVDQISYDASNGTITARVNATFNQAMSGDLRFSLYVVEDSVTGTGQGWDQHNYYYHSSQFVGPYYNLGNPYSYNGSPDGSTIPGWEHMQVFRYSPGPVWGTTGVIPASVTSGATYSQTYSFQVPSNVLNVNQVKLVGLVTDYSATNLSTNTVLDADEEPLIGTAPKYLITNVAVAAQTQYGTAKSNGTTPETMMFTNNGTDNVTLNLSVDSASIPKGWSATISPSSITVAAGATGNATVTITAPAQSAYVGITIFATPVKEGYIVNTTRGTVHLLSDNTLYPIFYDPNAPTPTPDQALLAGLPDSMKLHATTVPLSDSVIQDFPPENYPVSIYDNVTILDNGGTPNLPDPTILPDITAALAAGKKVFISSDNALGFAFDANDGYFAQFAAYTETPDVQNFYAQIGLSWTRTVRRWNTSTNALTPFSLKGTSGDPIGNGMNMTDAGGFLSEIYSIDSNSTPVYYGDGTAKNVLGSRYVDTATGGRLVYLGFGLTEITNQKMADTIAGRSITWLLASGSTAAVDEPAGMTSTGITALPNPFHGLTQIQYVAVQNERNVAFAAYDLIGREVAMLPTHSAGNNTYTATFDGSKLSSGTYVIIAHSSKGSSQVQVVNQQ
jgi:hypothetical protein